MTAARVVLSFLLLLRMALPVGAADSFELRYDKLAGALSQLSNADQEIVNDTIRLIKNGEHSLALARISSLNQNNPQNSSLRILASYLLLQVGNLAGAFEEAQKAHSAPNGNSYRCWFLAKVALVSGKKTVCKQELEHLKGEKEMAAEVKQLEKELAEN